MLVVKLIVYINCSYYANNSDLFSRKAVELNPGKESNYECAHKGGFCRSPGSFHHESPLENRVVASARWTKARQPMLIYYGPRTWQYFGNKYS